ncbi:MAG: hypothetical protein U0271_24060 [Polyangiaceae bacterium]
MKRSLLAGLAFFGAMSRAALAHAECPTGSHPVDGACVADQVDCPAGTVRDGEVCVAMSVDCPPGSAWRGSICYTRTRAVAIRTTGQVFTLMGLFWAVAGAMVAASNAHDAPPDRAFAAGLTTAAPIFGHALGAFTVGVSLWVAGAVTANSIPEQTSLALPANGLTLALTFE